MAQRQRKNFPRVSRDIIFRENAKYWTVQYSDCGVKYNIILASYQTENIIDARSKY